VNVSRGTLTAKSDQAVSPTCDPHQAPPTRDTDPAAPPTRDTDPAAPPTRDTDPAAPPTRDTDPAAPPTSSCAKSQDLPAGTLEAVFDDRAGLAVEYHNMLATRGIEWGLIGPREADRLWSRHILNSAAIAPLVPRDATVVDVGSGAGLPGIPLALARPDLRVWLLDSLLRRVNFLELAVEELALGDRVTVLRGRAEQCTEHFDVVVARAVAPLTRLIEWCEPLMGQMIALKGDSAETELADAGGVLKAHGLTAEVKRLDDGFGGEVTVIVVTRA